MRTKRLKGPAAVSDKGVARFGALSHDGVLWNDLTPYARNGTDVTGGGWPVFDGVGDYVIAPGPYVARGGADLPITADLTSATMECWAKPAAAGLAAHSRIISINSVTTTGYLIISLRTNGELRCYVNNSNRMNTAAGVITASNWFHIAMTAGTGVTPIIYVNGADVTSAGAGALAYPQSNSQISIGATLYNPGPSTTQLFNGTIDTARVYSKILSPDEVLMNYNLGRAAHS